MSRRAQLQQLRAAETCLAERRLALQQSGRARLAELRKLPPAWLLLGGFAAGVAVQRGGAWLARSGFASSVLVTGLRLSRLGVANLLAAAGQADS